MRKPYSSCCLTLTKLNSIHFFKAFFPAGVVAFTSESSIGTIPVTVRQLRSAGVP
ncbi:cation:dicarboxylate symporter family transporter [Bifidobacterium pseudocatenulatum]|uniref:cation:dicarboxylate symporter family transporter n=1 Tax=Bifidobacterium pseudocatenulatum TaxID=28026 RepID=UPI001CFD31DF